ncbi:MAG: Hsp20/alpha crystallin family protein [Verrucomicrobiota bacterium]
MGDIESIHLRRLHGQLGDVVYELSKIQFSRFRALESWQPAINAYRQEDCIIICVDLAGVDRQRIDLQIESRRLTIRGHRQPPEPENQENKPMQVLVMEIDYGRFEREVLLPSEVDSAKVTAEQRNGLLWVYLPFRCHA